MRVETKSDVSVQAAVWDRLLRLPLPFIAITLLGTWHCGPTASMPSGKCSRA